MRVNYLIMTHDRPQHLARIISRLRGEDVCFYIHVDKKSDISMFRSLVPEGGDVKYVADSDRIDCRWGDMSLFDAHLSLMRTALADGAVGYCTTISGQDYPLRTPEYISTYLDENPSCDFLAVYDVPDPKKNTENGGLERFISYTYDCLNPKDQRMKAKIQPLSLRPKTIVGFLRLARYRRDILPEALKLWWKKRSIPEGLRLAFTEDWYTLRVETVRHFLDVLDSRPDFLEYFKTTHMPDEAVLSAVLGGDPRIEPDIRPMCHYVDWDNREGRTGSPKSLVAEDWPAIRKAMEENPGLLYARKIASDSSLLEILDKQFSHE